MGIGRLFQCLLANFVRLRQVLILAPDFSSGLLTNFKGDRRSQDESPKQVRLGKMSWDESPREDGLGELGPGGLRDRGRTKARRPLSWLMMIYIC